MEQRNKVLFFVNRDSFPVNCAELDDFLSLVQENNKVELSDVESPTQFFKQCMARVEDYELIVPVTRNMYVRDKLRQEGVTLVICL
jgi:hypothetical protein